MKHLELHILQSVPVSCLNRDDLGSPKTAVFGGVQRSRVSSQSWKRAVRELAKELTSGINEHFSGFRTASTYSPLFDYLKEEGLSDADADLGAQYFLSVLNFSKETDDDSDENSESDTTGKVLFFTTHNELQCFAKNYVLSKTHEKLQLKPNKKGKMERPSGKSIKTAIKSVIRQSLRELGNTNFSNAADIALFGRMAASSHELQVEGAAMFSHALSTHKSDNDIDFFTAMEDSTGLTVAEPGATMMGTLEYNASTYYRFVALNLDMLADAKHLGALSLEERQEVVAVFVESVLKAIPAARKNSMNANTLPGYVLCVLRDTGHPIQLVNAFEQAVWSQQGKGVLQPSIEKMEKEYALLQEKWGISGTALRMPEVSLATVLKEAKSHVV